MCCLCWRNSRYVPWYLCSVCIRMWIAKVESMTMQPRIKRAC